MSDEVHSVFPDPAGEKHPDRQRMPRTAKDWIDAARRDISFNFAWESRDDGWYCHVCAPGGYRIRTGADPGMHEEQRNPDTHKRNLSWWIIRWFEKQNLPLPKWPDCYKDVHGQLWCHICLRPAGLYEQESGERHDRAHILMEWDVMRPGRLQPRFSRDNRKKRHFLDEILQSRHEGYDPTAEAAAARGEFGSAPDPARAPAVPGAFTARQGSSWQERMGHTYADDRVPINSRPAQNNKTHEWDQVTREQLDAWVDYTNPDTGEVTRWRVACETYDFCETRGIMDPCIGQGCGCNCHRDADKEAP